MCMGNTTLQGRISFDAIHRVLGGLVPVSDSKRARQTDIITLLFHAFTAEKTATHICHAEMLAAVCSMCGTFLFTRACHWSAVLAITDN